MRAQRASEPWSQRHMVRCSVFASLVGLAVPMADSGCARMPYTTQTIHEGPRVVVTAQREIESPSYTHPVQLTSSDIAALLKGFSLREQQSLPLRWFAEETRPVPVFQEYEMEIVSPYLAEALQRIGPDERAYFTLRRPGNNPKYDKDVLAGWVAVREPYLYLTVEHFHRQIPIRMSDPYDYNHPTPPPTPKTYILYFDPGRFWVKDPKGMNAVEFRQFLKSGEAGQGAREPVSVPSLTQ